VRDKQIEMKTNDNGIGSGTSMRTMLALPLLFVLVRMILKKSEPSSNVPWSKVSPRNSSVDKFVPKIVSELLP